MVCVLKPNMRELCFCGIKSGMVIERNSMYRKITSLELPKDKSGTTKDETGTIEHKNKNIKFIL